MKKIPSPTAYNMSDGFTVIAVTDPNRLPREKRGGYFKRAYYFPTEYLIEARIIKKSDSKIEIGKKYKLNGYDSKYFMNVFYEYKCEIENDIKASDNIISIDESTDTNVTYEDIIKLIAMSVKNNFVDEKCVKCSKKRHNKVDPCLGKLPGVEYACCGHGMAENAYIKFKNGVVIRGFTEIIKASDETQYNKNLRAFNLSQWIDELRLAADNLEKNLAHYS